MCIKLKAYASRRDAWSLCIKDSGSGLLFPMLLEGLSIKVKNHNGQNVLVLEGQIETDTAINSALNVRSEENKLVCDKGEIELFEPFSVNGALIKCSVILDGFAEEVGKSCRL